ncbi:MAG: nucleotide exchange factor GrpE [Acidaminococcales bacterium]|jgi:molecular chaperone GrpE|nr:nucleotide exchange factor GrpE [Acidaminococcales bacterium]
MTDEVLNGEQTPENQDPAAKRPDLPETPPAPEEDGAEQEAPEGDQQAGLEEMTARLKRLQADFDNFRRRSRAEAEQLSLFVSARLVGSFLPVMDSLERALAAGETEGAESLKKGLELICRQMEKSLADAGVEKIAALGGTFSPDLHEAVMNSQNPQLPDGQIDCVFEEGYKLKDKVIRHSKVRVVNNS